MLTEPMMRTLWPSARPGVVEGILRSLNALGENGVDTPLRLAHFMAQISHECDGGTIIRENMNYNAGRMIEIFGVGHHSAAVTQAQAQALAHHPDLIAERVYGLGNPKKAKELGNLESGDAYKYRGNGMLQLTGKKSHQEVGALIGVDLVNHPEQLEDPATSFRCALAEFKESRCIPAADADDVHLVTVRVNGGTNGLTERKRWLNKWKAALEAEAAQPATAPAKQIQDAVEANKEPRGAEVIPPSVSPETGVITMGGGGLTLAVLEMLKSLKEDLEPYATTFTGLKVVLVVCVLGVTLLTLHSLLVNRRNARRV